MILNSLSVKVKGNKEMVKEMANGLIISLVPQIGTILSLMLFVLFYHGRREQFFPFVLVALQMGITGVALLASLQLKNLKSTFGYQRKIGVVETRRIASEKV